MLRRLLSLLLASLALTALSPAIAVAAPMQHRVAVPMVEPWCC